MKLPDISVEVWDNNYRGPGENTVQDTWHRVASACAGIENEDIRQKVYEDFLWLLTDFKGSPGGRINANIGINSRMATTLYNCFVHDPAGCDCKDPDSIEGIYNLLKSQAHTLKSEGGYGTNFSYLRPAGTYIVGIGGRTPGVLKFMELWDKSSEIITIGSEDLADDRKVDEKKKIRKGAQMGVLSVWHPEIEAFIDAKLTPNRLTKFNLSVGITKGFIKALLNDEYWTLRFPDTNHDKYKTEWFGDIYDWESKGYPVVIHKEIRAVELWNKLMTATYTRNEPGVLFLDIANELNPLYYHENIMATNPCFSGDTLIAVADGRNAVTIKQLAEEENDVPVYSVNKKTGAVEIKTGRHPRITGYNKKLLRVHLDDNSYVDVTPDHKVVLLDGTVLEAKDLKCGMSLPRFTKALEPVKTGSKDYYQIMCNTKNCSDERVFEHRLIAKFHKQDEWNELYNNTKQNGFSKTGGLVIHHKDYNQLNNSPDNLQIMTFSDHAKLHGSIDQAGEKNGMFSGFSNEELKNLGLELTSKLGRRFANSEWQEFAKERNAPIQFSNFRKKELGSLTDFAKECASELGMDFIDSDTRCLDTYQKMLEQGYEARVENNVVLVKKTCEVCKKEFEIDHLSREISICSNECKTHYLNENYGVDTKSQLFFQKRGEELKIKQAKIYSQLKFDLKRKPLRKEWENECKNHGIPYRVGNILKFGFKSYKEVVSAGENYNHKVIKIEELPGEHTVYNITVDDNHTVAVITSTRFKRDNPWYSGIFLPNCGEIAMGLGVCLLFSLNLPQYIIKDHQGEYHFDYETFRKAVSIATRFSDNVNDISRLPVKDYERAIQEKRRIGLGVLGLGSLHYILGIRYGSKESLELVENIFKTKCESELLASAKLGKEKGSFLLFDREKYFNSKWWKELPISEEVKKEIEEIGEMRNSHHAANAPTGNMGVYVGCVSGGIEPVFNKEYDRWVTVSEMERNTLRNAGFKFPDVSKSEWFSTEYMKFSKKGDEEVLLGSFNGSEYQVDKNRGLTKKNTVQEYGWRFAINNFSPEKIERLTKEGVFATTDDLSVDDHVNTLGVIAKYVNMNSSKTVNLNNDYPYESFKNLYLNAWRMGIKGITSYRKGTMTAVLEDSSVKKKEKNKLAIEYTSPPKRPLELSCDIKKSKIDGEAWTIFVGLLGGQPYEIFGGLSKYVDIPNKYKSGKIVKNGKNSEGITAYNLVIGEGDDQMIIKDIANIFENKSYGAFTRILSLSLRHGAPIQFIVEQLQKDKNSTMTSFSKVMSRVLKSYIKNGTKSSDKICPECKSENSIIYQEGCMLCINCGHSKCG